MMNITEDTNGRGTRWVCPNDRQLALRAKLRTGWSVKTGSFETKWDYPSSCANAATRRGQSFVLTEEERQTIIQVIQRAEALDLSEQERIGRLVERLENMKRNVCIVTSTRLNERRSCGSRCVGGIRCVCACALCGEKFGAVLGATPSLCKDCRKYVCQKCGIETTGANGAISRSIMGTRSASATQLRVQDVSAMQRIVRRSPGNVQKQYLCRICAETREMWKKSGAWFIKGMPKYVLPEKKDRDWSRVPHKSSGWTGGRSSKSLEVVEIQDSSSDDDTTNRTANVWAHPPSPLNTQGSQDNTMFKTVSPSSLQSSGNIPRSPRAVRANGLSLQSSREEYPDRLDKSSLSIASQCHRLSPTSSISTVRTRTSCRAANGPHAEQRVSFEDEILIDEKTKAGGANDGDADNRKGDWKNSHVQSLRPNSATAPSTPTTPTFFDRLQEPLRYHEKTASREGSQLSLDQDDSSSRTPTKTDAEIPRIQATEYPQEIGQDYGTLEVCLRYDPAAQCLQCKVERARGLQPMDIHGLADPFCKLNILPIETGATNKRLRTKTVHKTRDPEFNETVNFYGMTECDIWSSKALHVLILQDDPAGQDFLGEARLPLHELHAYQSKHYNVLLQDHYPVDSEETAWGECTTGRGQIQMSLSYCTRRRALTVTIHRAINLLPMDSNGFSDPFVKLCLIEDAKDNHRQHRVFDYSIARSTAKKLVSKKMAGRNTQSTSVKKKTLNPEWNEEFVFSTRLTDLMKLTLCLSVWDKDFGKSDDYLGGLELNCNSKGARLRHWIDAMKFPDHRHRAWHNLTESSVATE